MNEEVKKHDQELGEIVHELRKTLESKTAESAENREKVEKMTNQLGDLEKANQELVIKQQKAIAEADAQKERMDELEAKFCRPQHGATGNVQSEEMKNFKTYITHKAEQLQEMGFKYLRTDNNVDGGYLAPPEFVAEIIKKITEISPVRQLARVRNTDSKSMRIPSRAALVTSYWTGEGKSLTASNSTYGREEIPMHKMTALVEMTWEELQDAAFNMQTEINSDVAESLAQLEGAAFVSGDAVEKPEGFMTAAGTTTVNSGVANDITWDAMITMMGTLKRGYNPVFGFNRLTWAEIIKKKDGVGRYLWTPGNLAAGIPNTIMGTPYTLLPDMDNVDADNHPIVYADFAKGYVIGDRVQMGLIKDETTKADEGKVRFVFNRRAGGQVVLPEAIVKMKCSV